MKLELGQLGAGGLIQDIKPFDLPPNIFNKTLNADFNGYCVFPVYDESPTLVPLPFGQKPLAILQGWVHGNIPIWIAATESSVYLLYTNLWYGVTPANMNRTSSWNLFSFNGYIVLNSPDNPPYYVDIFDYLKPVEVLPNWPSTLQVNKLVSFSGFLVGLGLTSSDGYFDRQMVFWSDVAEIGQLPSNYSFDDPTSRAGFTLLEDFEEFVGAELLRNELIVYRQNSIFGIRFVGGNAVFALTRKTRNTNLLNANSVAELNNLHFFVGKDDFFWFDGLNARPVGQGKVANTFFKEADLSTVFVIADSEEEKIFVHYKDKVSGESFAYVYRAQEQLFFKQTVPNGVCSSGMVLTEEQGKRWADLIDPWLALTIKWKVEYIDTRPSSFVWCNDNRFAHISEDATYKEVSIERVSLAFFEQDQSGNLTVNRTKSKVLSEIWPELNDGKINIAFACSDVHTAEPVYSDAQLFDQAIDLKQDWFLSTKYLSIKFDNKAVDADPYYFELTGLALELNAGGKY